MFASSSVNPVTVGTRTRTAAAAAAANRRFGRRGIRRWPAAAAAGIAWTSPWWTSRPPTPEPPPSPSERYPIHSGFHGNFPGNNLFRGRGGGGERENRAWFVWGWFGFAGVRGVRILLRGQPWGGGGVAEAVVRGELEVLRAADGGEDGAAEEQQPPGIHPTLRREARSLVQIRRSAPPVLLCSPC